MIVVTVRRDGIEISGHARAAPVGKDIVCSAVSALWQTLIKSIKDLTDDKIEYELRQGQGHITFERLSEKSEVLVDSFFIGIYEIARSYPDNVVIQAK